MHDCHTIKDALLELAFDELSPERKLSLLVEIESCADCRSLYRETTEALYAVDEAATRARPGEAYWLAYDERLLNQLKRVEIERRTEQDERSTERVPRRWTQIFAARLSVPYPVAAIVVLLLIVSTAMTLRARRSDNATAAAPPQTAETRTVEVPVVHEKVVTRTVYVERRGRMGRAAQVQSTVARTGEPNLVAREAAGATTAPLTRKGLAGFQPTDDVKLTIIKANEENKR